MTATNVDRNTMAVFFCGDYSSFGKESEKAFQAGRQWLPKSLARKISSREINSVTNRPVDETMLANSMGVFVVAPLWLGDEKGFEFVTYYVNN